MRAAYFFGLVAVALGALVISAVAPAAGGGRVLRFIEVERTSNDVFVDINGDGKPAAGDSFMQTSQLYAWAKGGGRGAHIGHVRVMCTLEGVSTTNPERVRGAFCQGTFFLRGGTVGAAGYVRFTSPTTNVPVTGGTGAYAGSRGTFTSRTLRDNSEVTISADIMRLLP